MCFLSHMSYTATWGTLRARLKERVDTATTNKAADVWSRPYSSLDKEEEALSLDLLVYSINCPIGSFSTTKRVSSPPPCTHGVEVGPKEPAEANQWWHSKGRVNFRKRT